MKHVPVLRHPDLFEGEGRCVVIQRDQERFGSTDPDHADRDCDHDLRIDGKRGGRQ